MSKFYSLFSSSKGNASFVGGPSGGILVDAGVSCRRLTRSLAAHDIPAEAVQAICITHAHSDHIAGLRVFLKSHPVPVYATEETLQELSGAMALPDVPLRAVTPQKAGIIAGVEVLPFSTMHDAAGSCGYRFALPDGQSCAVCTDLGCVTQEVWNTVSGTDLVLLEANYDPEMLRNGPYPLYLQERIAGEEGHLSNFDSAGLAEQLIRSGTTRLVLGHLSQNNNTMPLAERTVLTHLREEGMARNRDFLLQVSSPEGLEQAVIF